MKTSTPRTPLISVLMCVYNAEKHVNDTIVSILNQTYINFEYIIINDCSTDSTLSLIKKMSDSDSRIRLINNPMNVGLTKSLNFGIYEAKGKYIARMDADDIAVSVRFEEQVKFLELNHDITICGSWYKRFGDENRKCRLFYKDSDIKSRFLWETCIAHPSVMVRRDFLIKNNFYYDESFKTSQDFELWERIFSSSDAKFANIRKFLLLYRVHNESITKSKSKISLDNRNRIRQRQLEKLFQDNYKTEYLDLTELTFLGNIFTFEDILQCLKFLVLVRNVNLRVKQYPVQEFNRRVEEKIFKLLIISIKLIFNSKSTYQENLINFFSVLKNIYNEIIKELKSKKGIIKKNIFLVNLLGHSFNIIFRKLYLH